MKNLVFSFFLFFIGIFQMYSQCSNPPTITDPEDTGHLDLMNVPCAWTLTNGDPSVAVAVLDQDMHTAHTDLVGKVINTYGTCSPANGNLSHGIQALGAVAAIRNNGTCVAGTGGDSKVGAFCYYGSDSSIKLAVDNGYKIITISSWSSISTAGMEYAVNNGAVVLIAGLCEFHQAADPNGYHSVPGVIHVGRAYNDLSFWPYTSGCPGAENQNMDVLAVTDGVWRLSEQNSCEQAGGGSSIGTPMIAGVVALMRSVNPCLLPGDIEEILVQTSNPSTNLSASRGGVIDAYAAVLMAQNFQGFDQVFTNSEVIDNLHVSGDMTIEPGVNITVQGTILTGEDSRIIVKEGATLRVEGMIKFGHKSGITVKRGAILDVDGGTLTNSDCTDKWQSIRVEGNSNMAQQTDPNGTIDPNKSGIVIFNDATVENAETAVSMFPYHIQWPATMDYLGGYVEANNTTFQNNDRAVEFMRYLLEDESSFTGCTFYNHNTAVSHWSNFGVTYDACTFDETTKNGISTYDATIKVYNGCEFYNYSHNQFDQASIELYHTYPTTNISGAENTIIGTTDSQINEFHGGYNGVFSEAIGGTYGLEIKNNIFLGQERGLYIQGISRHEVEENDFVGNIYGNTIHSNGDGFNTKLRNNYSSNGVGIFTFLDNQNYNFLNNCFDYTWGKDVVVHSGNILLNQGDIDVAASNIFSDDTGARQGIDVPNFNANDPNNFVYWIPEGTPQIDVLVPRTYPNKEFESQSLSTNECGSGQIGSISVPRNSCNIPNGKEEIMDYIEQLESEIEELLEENFLPGFPTGYYINRYNIAIRKRCIQRAKSQLIFLCGKMKEFTELSNQFANDEFVYQSQVFGTMLDNGEYHLASNYLNSLSGESEEEYDFITTQQINLKRLSDYQYLVTPQELNTLYSIGIKTFPMSGYARSLYKYLTGIKIDVPNGQYLTRGDEPQALHFDIPEDKFGISPNPSSDRVSLKYEIELDAILFIYNNQGQLMQKTTLSPENQQRNLSIADLNAGMYYLVLRDQTSEELIYTTKLIKQ